MSNTSQKETLFLNSRREFITNCAVLAGAPLLAGLPVNAFAAGGGKERLKVGIVGTGGRGTGAVNDALKADPAVEIWAAGDIFADNLEKGLRKFSKNARVNLGERRFSGFNAYKQVIDSGIDIVLLATPPHFRPAHIEYALEKGVHVFAEKPVAVDPAGCRKVIALSEVAKAKGLSIVAGTQRRHDPSYIETLRRIREGAIGELVGGQAYWVGSTTDSFWPHHKRKEGESEMEYQLRNWYAFTWLCGDHIVEQHVHNLDIINWAFGGPPVKAFGMGGRQTRNWGDIWDHFSVEFEYANGARVQSFCRQTDNTSYRVSERLVGTKGVAEPHAGKIRAAGEKEWRFPGKNRSRDAYVQEHIDLIRGIREGKPVNEGRALAEATLTGVLGRLSAYTGKEISYKWVLEASKLDLAPAAYDFNAAPPPSQIAVPGKTRLV
jgi:predicted dehydrogenase